MLAVPLLRLHRTEVPYEINKTNRFVSQNHREIEVGKYLWISSNPTYLLKQIHLEQMAQECVQKGLECLQRRHLSPNRVFNDTALISSDQDAKIRAGKQPHFLFYKFKYMIQIHCYEHYFCY